MSSDIAISAGKLCKTYRLFDHPGDRVRQFLAFGLKQYHRQFIALQDVSVDIKKGETVGIIGRNGSGKSSLLQLICGTLKPTSGTVLTRGRVCALLELGAGFNGEFTGRENVHFQGALMGFSKAEIDRRFDGIAAFADIGEYMDQPVRTYSSGMFVRLAFATMIHSEADILVIDEALAVGDEIFQRKCFEQLRRYLEGDGKVLLFVSHNVQQIERVCSRVIWMEKGRVIRDGNATTVCRAYQKHINEKTYVPRPTGQPLPNVADSGEIEVLQLRLLGDDGDGPVVEFESHSALRVIVDFACRSPLGAPEIVVGIQSADSAAFITAATTATLAEPHDFACGQHRFECRIPDLALLPGSYAIRLGFLDRFRRPVWIGRELNPFRVSAPPDSRVARLPPGLVDLPYEWKFRSSSPTALDTVEL